MIKTVIMSMDTLLFEKEHVEHYKEQSGIPVKEGVSTLLSYLKTHDYRTVLAANQTESYAKEILKAADIEKYFDHLIFANMIEKAKPDPEIFVLASKKSYTPAEECLVLEDSADGVFAAHAAGCHVILITEGETVDAKVEAMADAVEDSLKEVLEIVKL